MNISYHPSWEGLFAENRERLQKIEEFLQKRDDITKVFPLPEHRYRVFEADLASVRVVLLGQDPYHGPHQAHGLSFSVPEGIKVPPSLKNIFKEIQATYPERNYVYSSTHGDLSRWATEEGIFLLNASLSVEEGNPGSHMRIWKEFTDRTIQYISRENPRAIFLLLGGFAQEKASLIEGDAPARIVATSHPSPLGAHRGFLGSRVFRTCEEKLGETIDWSL